MRGRVEKIMQGWRSDLRKLKLKENEEVTNIVKKKKAKREKTPGEGRRENARGGDKTADDCYELINKRLREMKNTKKYEKMVNNENKYKEERERTGREETRES